MGRFALGSADEDEELVSDGKRSKAYVRFDQTHKLQSGPMCGPYDMLQMRDNILSGFKHAGKSVPIAERKDDKKWYLFDAPEEPGYSGFSVVFS